MRKYLSLLLCVVLLSVLFALPVQAAELEITAPSAILMEAESGKILYEKNAHEIRPCASITKVMTLILVMEAIDSGKIGLEDQVAASAYASSMGGSDIWLKEGEVMSVDDLLKATVIMSANDAAVVLAEYVSGSVEEFVRCMNEKAGQLGMEDTVFKNPNGLDEEGHVTSAHDVALMSRELIRHEKIFDYTLTWIDYVRNGETQLVNTNKLIRTYQGITGLKTGTTGAAGSCITATAERNGLKLVSVVLGCDTTEHRFQDAAALLDLGFANWSSVKPEKPELQAAAVAGGMEKTVEIRCGEAETVVVPKGREGELTVEIQLDEPLEAPVQKGDAAGRVLYRLDGEILRETVICAAEDVEEMSFGKVYARLFQYLTRL